MRWSQQNASEFPDVSTTRTICCARRLPRSTGRCQHRPGEAQARAALLDFNGGTTSGEVPPAGRREEGLHLPEDAALSLFRPADLATDLLHEAVLPVAVERRPPAFWDDSKMADVLHHVLDELHHTVALRDIRHYFIAGVNLLEHVQPSFASDLVTKSRAYGEISSRACCGLTTA